MTALQQLRTVVTAVVVGTGAAVAVCFVVIPLAMLAEPYVPHINLANWWKSDTITVYVKVRP